MVGGSKNLKLSTNTGFDVSFQKNVFSSFLLFSSVCYQDDLSDSKRSKIASSTARNFNYSWNNKTFSETINFCRNIWLIENWKCQLFNLLKESFSVMRGPMDMIFGALWETYVRLLTSITFLRYSKSYNNLNVRMRLF